MMRDPCSANLPFLGRSAAVLGFREEKPQTARSSGLRYTHVVFIHRGAAKPYDELS